MQSLPIAVKYLITFIVSMVPIIELRGAIPIAESLGLIIFLYYPIAIIGNMLPVPFIYLFARIPLPGTGAWTGTLAASFLKIDFKTSIAAVTLGVLLAGLIMSLGSKIVSILGWPGVFAIIAILLVIILISIFIKKRKKK